MTQCKQKIMTVSLVRAAHSKLQHALFYTQQNHYVSIMTYRLGMYNHLIIFLAIHAVRSSNSSPPPPPPSNTPPSPHWFYDLQFDIRVDKLIHSLHNRQIFSLEGFIVSAHRLSCPARSPPRPPAPSCPNPGPQYRGEDLSLAAEGGGGRRIGRRRYIKY